MLTHTPQPPLAMQGGTTFHFVTDSIESALKQAFAAAQGKDVRLGGGPATVRQYLKAGLIDGLHLVQVPLFMGQGERIECVEFTPSKAVVHLKIVRKSK